MVYIYIWFISIYLSIYLSLSIYIYITISYNKNINCYKQFFGRHCLTQTGADEKVDVLLSCNSYIIFGERRIFPPNICELEIHNNSDNSLVLFLAH